MHYEVAQMVLSANHRSKSKILAGVTIEEVEATIQKEDGKISRIDQGIDALFNRRGSNPLSMARVSEEFAH